MTPTKAEILQKYYAQKAKRASDQTLYQNIQSSVIFADNNDILTKLILKGLKHEIIDCKSDLTRINKRIKKLENEINN